MICRLHSPFIDVDQEARNAAVCRLSAICDALAETVSSKSFQ
jgi:hypothetical protein